MPSISRSVCAVVGCAAAVLLSSLGPTQRVLAQIEPPSGGASPQVTERETTERPALLPAPTDELLAELEAVYKDLHAQPELAMQERRTAGIAASWLREHGFEVTENLGGTGVVGLLRNGEGATVLLRADMDALPMKEETGLTYASTQVFTDNAGRPTPVAHSCGHDMHVTWLMGAARILAENRDKWRGTVMAVFQPAEETGEGARAMLNDGMVERFPKPDIVLGQHVMPMPAGHVGTRAGLLLSMSDTWEVTLFGRGGHGSSPQSTVDPVVMGAAAVLRLQTIVAREIGMNDSAVVTVGAFQAGSSGNIIPDQAVLRINVRTVDEQVRQTVLAAIKRIFHAEAQASAAPQPPTFTVQNRFPPTYNDAAATRKLVQALVNRFDAERVHEIPPASASEDFSEFARAWDVPAVYWTVGGTDPQLYAQAKQAGRLNEIPSNHSPQFAPVIHPTLETGIEAMLAAAGAWLVPAETRP